MNSGQLVIIDNEVFEIIKVEFNCLVYLKKFYNEGEVVIIERDISTVKNAIFNMMARGVNEELL